MTKGKIFIFILICALIATTTTSVVLYMKLSAASADPQKIAQEQADAIVYTVGKLIVLPQGETPSVVKITDPSRLQDQAFFQNAKTGDDVLLYYNEKKAILYSPTDNKVVDIAPFNVDNSQTPVASSTQGSSTNKK